MLTVLTLLKLKPSPNGEQHGERPFWREFGPRYLDAWLASVARYVPQPHRVMVMTDSPVPRLFPAASGLVDAEARWLDKTVDAPGFWAKLEMFKHGVGKCLFMDLDNAINGPLDELCALEPEPLIMLDDRRVPGLPNGSMVLFDAERCRFLWNSYARIPREIEGAFVARGDDYSKAYDQAYIAERIERQSYGRDPRFFQDLLPAGYILNARSELPNAPDWRTARVIFGGGAEGKIHLSTHPGYSFK